MPTLAANAAPPLLPVLDTPRRRFEHVTPNWYAAVMGTGIVANATAVLPVRLPGLRAVGTVVWLLAVVLLILVTAATVAHWAYHPQLARRHHSDPVMRHFYGAPPMALLTVGAGTLLLGSDLIGQRAAVAIDAALWAVGTVVGLGSAVAVPYLQFTRRWAESDGAFGGWLMPVVPPMVSAATGALLLPHLPAGQARLDMLLGCYAMFGLSLLASLVVITLMWGRLAQHQIGAAALVPTLWIVLGPLGQSITAANLLGGAAHLAIPAPYATGLLVLGVAYGVPVLGFALLWAALASAITIRTARAQLPFSLTWWAFTFPVGTCVTGLIGLSAHTGSTVVRGASVVAYGALLVAWLTVAVKTTRGVINGELLRATSQARPPGLV